MALLPYDEFLRRVDAVRIRMDQACLRSGRPAGSVGLLPVTKTHPAEAADYAAKAGLMRVGENRVQEAAEKKSKTQAQLGWELIGHLQSNKAKIAARTFSRIQSVDSQKLLNVLDRSSAELGTTLAILLQINAGRDPAKSGAEPEEAGRLLEHALGLTHLKVEGLMTIAPLSDDPECARRTFIALRELRDRLSSSTGSGLKELSMGMSSDMESAIEAGSTLVRVGTALFGAR